MPYNTTIQKREVFFFSFKGQSKVSTLDHISLPPMMGMQQGRGGNWHSFGEWCARTGKGLGEPTTDEQICRWAVEYFNLTRHVLNLSDSEPERRFDRMAMVKEKPKHYQ